MSAFDDLLGLPEFDINGVKEDQQNIILTLTPRKETRSCPHCGSSVVQKNGKYIRICQDMPIRMKRVLLRIKTSQYKCLAPQEICTQKIFVPRFECIHEKDQITKRLKLAIRNAAFEKGTFSSVANQFFVNVETVRRAFIEEMYERNLMYLYKETAHIGIDEAHLCNNMRAVLIDTAQVPAKIIDILPTHKKKDVCEALSRFNNPCTIETVSMDMYVPYREAVRECLPYAKIIIDPFHVVSKVLSAMELARKEYYEHILKEARALPEPDKTLEMQRIKRLGMNHYWFKTNHEDLTDDSKRRLAAIIREYPVFGDIYRLKEAFRRIYSESLFRDDAEQQFQTWKESIPAEPLYNPFRDVVKTVSNWYEYIFNYFDLPKGERYSNGPVESVNRVIKDIMRDGRGYDFEILRGKLVFGNTRVEHLPCSSKTAACGSYSKALYCAYGELHSEKMARDCMRLVQYFNEESSYQISDVLPLSSTNFLYTPSLLDVCELREHYSALMSFARNLDQCAAEAEPDFSQPVITGIPISELEAEMFDLDYIVKTDSALGLLSELEP